MQYGFALLVAFGAAGCGSPGSQDRDSAEVVAPDAADVRPSDAGTTPDPVGGDSGALDRDAGVESDTGVTLQGPAALYDESSVVEFRLDFAPDQWAQFQAYRAAGVKAWVHCSLTFQGHTFADAACRSKGNPEVWPDEPKPELKVKFNEWVSGVRFFGVRELNLEANPYHAAPVRDRLGMWLMRKAGLAASRANHARVFVGGSYLGLYQNVEPLEKEFLEEHFSNPTGNLYAQGEELKTNKTVNDVSRLEALQTLVDEEPLKSDHAAFYAQLEQMMDVHEVIRELAVEALLPTADNFSNGSDNFYYYDDPGRGFVVLPWDLDTILDEYSPPDADGFEYWGGAVNNPPNKLRQLINANPAWRAEYVNTLVELRDGPYAQLPAEIARECAQVRDAHIADVNRLSTADEFDLDCMDLQARIAARIAFLKTALGR